MKCVLVALNAKYIHTNLAVRAIAAACRGTGVETVVAEFTVNEPLRPLLAQLYAHRADVYAFSCYIWNIDAVMSLAQDLHALLPQTVLCAGGPQAAGDAAAFLQENPAFGLVAIGEGEATIPALLSAMTRGEDTAGVPGVSLLREGTLHTSPPTPMDMDALPFAYHDLDSLGGRIPYYESSRGCPYRCAYCVSGGGQGVRARSLPLVYSDLARFLEARVPQVKLVDRTFNWDQGRALAIWRYLQAHDNGVTNFHFELAGDLLDDAATGFLAGVRPGLFQFEIGVQSVNTQTLEAIGRRCNLERLFHNVRRLQQAGNIHLHLDLIAGLPYEDMEGFACSFNTVHALGPHQLQLGFLKVLPGTAMEAKAKEWGIVYSRSAPFQVLQTRQLDFAALTMLEGTARMVETYHNSGRFNNLLACLLEGEASPFAFYLALWRYFEGQGHHRSPPSKTAWYDILAGFAAGRGQLDTRARWLCLLDVVLHEKPRKLPACVPCQDNTWREAVRAYYRDREKVARDIPAYSGMDPVRTARLTHMEVFPFHPVTGSNLPTAVLVDYKNSIVRYLEVSTGGGGKIL